MSYRFGVSMVEKRLFFHFLNNASSTVETAISFNTPTPEMMEMSVLLVLGLERRVWR
jgi:hypothetical protein